MSLNNVSATLLTPRSAKQTMTIEIIEDTLYWISSKDIPNKQADSIFIFSDQSHRYQPFNFDFGPLHLGEVFRFVNKLDSAIRICRKSSTKICVFTGVNPQKQANSIFLLCSYLILKQNVSPEKSLEFFSFIERSLPAYRDSTADPYSPHKCYLVDCLKGLSYAHKLKWFDFSIFDVQEYEYISLKGNGDYNEIIPGKMIAFSGPLNQRPYGSYGEVYTPQDYVPLFKRLGVSLVVRLNDKKYDEKIFIQNGIDHIDLIFDDGSTPSDEIVNRFLEVSEKTRGIVAVHCKSGLGRTGTLIGMYAMKHYKIPAKEFIGWMRIARPGSIHGPQHEYLVDKQEEMFNLNSDTQAFSSPVKVQKNYGRTTATPVKSDLQSTADSKNQQAPPSSSHFNKQSVVTSSFYCNTENTHDYSTSHIKNSNANQSSFSNTVDFRNIKPLQSSNYSYQYRQSDSLKSKNRQSSIYRSTQNYNLQKENQNIGTLQSDKMKTHQRYTSDLSSLKFEIKCNMKSNQYQDEKQVSVNDNISSGYTGSTCSSNSNSQNLTYQNMKQAQDSYEQYNYRNGTRRQMSWNPDLMNNFQKSKLNQPTDNQQQDCWLSSQSELQALTLKRQFTQQ